MAQPLYFLPDLRESAAKDVALRKQILKERGLLEVFADVPMVEQPLAELTGRGPGDKSGCMLYYQTPSGDIPRRAGYYPSEQSWTPVGDGSLLWIGVDTAEPPKPEEMARKKRHNGYWVELGDGNKWLVPVIRRPDDSTELPADMVWDSAGRLIKPIKAAYQAYWNETAEVAAYFFEDAELSEGRALELAIRALSLNYRYDRTAHNILRAVDTATWPLVIGCTVDLPKSDALADAQKKMNAPLQAESITPGAPGDCQDTGQAVANST